MLSAGCDRNCIAAVLATVCGQIDCNTCPQSSPALYLQLVPLKGRELKQLFGTSGELKGSSLRWMRIWTVNHAEQLEKSPGLKTQSWKAAESVPFRTDISTAESCWWSWCACMLPWLHRHSSWTESGFYFLSLYLRSGHYQKHCIAELLFSNTWCNKKSLSPTEVKPEFVPVWRFWVFSHGPNNLFRSTGNCKLVVDVGEGGRVSFY